MNTTTETNQQQEVCPFCGGNGCAGWKYEQEYHEPLSVEAAFIKSADYLGSVHFELAETVSCLTYYPGMSEEDKKLLWPFESFLLTLDEKLGEVIASMKSIPLSLKQEALRAIGFDDHILYDDIEIIKQVMEAQG
jgi:hypothetical protein